MTVLLLMVWSVVWRVALIALAARVVYEALLMLEERKADRDAFGDAKLVKQFRAENVLIARKRATPPENA